MQIIAQSKMIINCHVYNISKSQTVPGEIHINHKLNHTIR
jgi:hypothetical protein